MQTAKGRVGSLDVPQKTSPVAPRGGRPLKASSSEPDSISSQPASRTPKDRSPKVTERKSPKSPSPRSPVAEKKRPSRIAELESQLAQLQENLKTTKEQLSLSESFKGQAQQEVEEARKQLLVLAGKYEECQRQLLELTDSEENRILELRKISQERDKAWETELEAVQKQQSAESTALSSALCEIQRLKIQLETSAHSAAENTHTEIKSLQLDLANYHSVIEHLERELDNCKESEANTRAMVTDALQQLETARSTVETLRLDGKKAKEAYSALSMELEQSRARVNMLEELVGKLQMDLDIAGQKQSGNTKVDNFISEENEKSRESDKLRIELSSMKLEVGELRSALEAVETRYQEEQIQCTMKVRSAYELVEQVKSDAGMRGAEIESELKKTKAHVEELKANLMDKETELQGISEENEGLSLKIEKVLSSQRPPELDTGAIHSKAEIAELKMILANKEKELQIISEENETLESEIKKREPESKMNDETLAEIEAARLSEREALMKLDYVSEEAEKSTRRAERATEQLEAVQIANSEMEAELRRLKVQSDQWRKAAEAAAAVLSAGNNGKCMDRAGSFDSNYHSVTSPYLEDMDDDSPKKKNMLKKLGGLWKKGQK